MKRLAIPPFSPNNRQSSPCSFDLNSLATLSSLDISFAPYFGTGAISYEGAISGSGDSTIFLECTGNETTLEDCFSDDPLLPINHCVESKEAGVRCDPEGRGE